MIERYQSIFKEPEGIVTSFFLEKTFNIKKDVDFLYDKGFKSFIDTFQKSGELSIIDYIELSSGKLQTNDSRKAHKENPITIKMGFTHITAYNPFTRTIYISVPEKAYTFFLNKEDEATTIKSNIIAYQNDLTENRIKASIAHELSHWISDSLHSSHLKKLFTISKNLNDADYIKLKHEDVNMTYFEIDAQIHGIKNLKQRYNIKDWDEITTESLFMMYTSLRNIYYILYKTYGLDICKIWLKALFKRMSREKLLGQNMKMNIDAKKLTEDAYSI